MIAYLSMWWLQMPETSIKLEEFKERMRSRHNRNSPQSRFRIPWYILIVNILLIAYIIFSFNRRGDQETRKEALIEYGGVEYHFVISQETDGNDYILTLATKSLLEKTILLGFQESVAAVGLYRGERELSRIEMGRGVNKVELRHAEMRSYTGRIPGSTVREIAADNSDMIQPVRRSLVMTDERHIPVTVKLTINTKPSISTIFNFKLYGIK